MSQLLPVLFLSFFSLAGPSAQPRSIEACNNKTEVAIEFSYPKVLPSTSESSGPFFSEPKRLLIWQQSRPLRWHDFKGIPEKGDKIHGAVTYAGLDVEVADNGPLQFSVVAVFDPFRSWVHPERKDPELLAHEQLHFDIAAVYAMKLEQKLNSLRNKWDREKIKKIISIYEKAQLKSQQRYDDDSLHGIRKDQQQAWRKLINRELLKPSSSLSL